MDADVRLVRDAFSQYPVAPVSAIQGDGIDELYDKIAELAKKVRR